MSATKIALRQQQKHGQSTASKAMSGEVSPDSKCPICLDIFHNISYVNLCLHKFCFRCIHEWSKNKAECPLCKQPFNSIYHSIKSEKDFKKYDLRPTDNGSFGNFGGARFRYRTTLTGVRAQYERRTSQLPDNGVMFEGQGEPADARQQRGIRRMMMRQAARRRAASEGRVVRSVREEEMVNFRRELYRQGVRVRSVRDGGRSRDTTADFYQKNPACLHRLVPWLKRELAVLYGAHGSLVNIVQHVIMSRITRYDMEDGAIQEELRPFLQARTEHFLHEFISFAKSPFNIEAYDQHAVYDCPGPSSNEDCSSNSSVIAISEDEQTSVDLDPPGDSMSSGALSLSAWDDETPGPSYSVTTEWSRAPPLSVPDSDSDSSVGEERQAYVDSPQQRSPSNQGLYQGKLNNGGALSSDDDDCVIIGFVKPTSERTPELVKLSSDSEESTQEDTKDIPELPQHIRFTSPSPSPSPSPTSQICHIDCSGWSAGKVREACRLVSQQSPSTSSRHESSSKSERKGRDHLDRNRRRPDSHHKSSERGRPRSRDRNRRSTSAEDGHRSRDLPTRSWHSHSSSRDAKWDSNNKKWESGSFRHSSFSNDAPSRSYHRLSSNHYSRERGDSRMQYTDSRSHRSSSRRNIAQRSYSPYSSRSCSRESHKRDRRHSRSRTYSSSCSPSTKRAHNDKPGGKRKYKTRHLEEPSSLCTKDIKKSRVRDHKKDKSGKTSRSVSVEILDEENSPELRRKHHKKKKKHKKKGKRRHKTKEHTEKHSPTVITIDSDHSVDGDVQVSQENSNIISGNHSNKTPLESSPILDDDKYVHKEDSVTHI